MPYAYSGRTPSKWLATQRTRLYPDLIDPIERYLEIFRLEAGRWRQVRIAREDERVRAEPFEALEIDLAILWQWHAALG